MGPKFDEKSVAFSTPFNIAGQPGRYVSAVYVMPDGTFITTCTASKDADCAVEYLCGVFKQCMAAKGGAA